MKSDLDDISKHRELCNVRPDYNLLKIGQLHRLYS